MRHACPCPRNPRYFWSFIFPVCAGRRSSVFGVLRVSIPPDLQAALGTHVRRQLCDARVARDEHPLCARKARHLCTQCAGKPHLNTAYETCLQDKRHLLHDAEGAARAEQGGRDKERERVCVRVRTERYAFAASTRAIAATLVPSLMPATLRRPTITLQMAAVHFRTSRTTCRAPAVDRAHITRRTL